VPAFHPRRPDFQKGPGTSGGKLVILYESSPKIHKSLDEIYHGRQRDQMLNKCRNCVNQKCYSPNKKNAENWAKLTPMLSPPPKKNGLQRSRNAPRN
jgi:hypothetical protein